MQLDVIGAGPAYTDRLGATGAAYLVRSDSTAVLLDLGQGSFPRLTSVLEPSTLDAVLISHLHPDHYIDLIALRHYLHWEFHPGRRVRVIGPATLESRLDGLHDQPGFTATSLDVEDLSARSIDIGGLHVTAGRVAHTDESYGLRVSAATGPAIVYSGDCGRAADLEALIRPGDALLAEVSFGAGPVPPGALHLAGPAVGQLAARARAGRVLLTHIQMGFDPGATIDAVVAAYDGPVELVQPGDRFEV